MNDVEKTLEKLWAIALRAAAGEVDIESANFTVDCALHHPDERVTLLALRMLLGSSRVDAGRDDDVTLH